MGGMDSGTAAQTPMTVLQKVQCELPLDSSPISRYRPKRNRNRAHTNLYRNVHCGVILDSQR